MSKILSAIFVALLVPLIGCHAPLHPSASTSTDAGAPSCCEPEHERKSIIVNGAMAVFDVSTGSGVIDEFTIGSSDITATVDTFTSGDSGVTLGTIRAIRVIAGSGTFKYVDDRTSVIRTITGLNTGDELAPIACRTIKGTSNGSSALTLRVRW